MRVHHFRFHYCSFGVGVLGVAVDDVVVVDGVAGDVGDAVGRHGDPLGDRFLAEPPTIEIHFNSKYICILQ